MSSLVTSPRSDADIFSEEVMASPYAVFRELRDAGPVVYLERFDVFAVARYEEARHVLGDWESFSSADIALNKQFNDLIGQGILRADPRCTTNSAVSWPTAWLPGLCAIWHPDCLVGLRTSSAASWRGARLTP